MLFACDFVKYMDNTIAPTEYYFTGNVTLVLSDKEIIMYFNNTSNPNSIPHQKYELINPNFEYHEKSNSAKDEIKVKVNNNYLEFDQSPIMVNHRTLVPLRAIAEAIGATVNWNEKTREVTILSENKTVNFKVGQNTIITDGKETILDIYPVIVNSRTLVPVRALSEAFGCVVGWIEDGQTVIISY